MSHTGLSHRILFEKRVHYKKVVKPFLWPFANTRQASRAPCRHRWSTGQSCSVWTHQNAPASHYQMTVLGIWNETYLLSQNQLPRVLHIEAHRLATSELFCSNGLRWGINNKRSGITSDIEFIVRMILMIFSSTPDSQDKSLSSLSTAKSWVSWSHGFLSDLWKRWILRLGVYFFALSIRKLRNKPVVL